MHTRLGLETGAPNSYLKSLEACGQEGTPGSLPQSCCSPSPPSCSQARLSAPPVLQRCVERGDGSQHARRLPPASRHHSTGRFQAGGGLCGKQGECWRAGGGLRASALSVCTELSLRPCLSAEGTCFFQQPGPTPPTGTYPELSSARLSARQPGTRSDWPTGKGGSSSSRRRRPLSRVLF